VRPTVAVRTPGYSYRTDEQEACLLQTLDSSFLRLASVSRYYIQQGHALSDFQSVQGQVPMLEWMSKLLAYMILHVLSSSVRSKNPGLKAMRGNDDVDMINGLSQPTRNEVAIQFAF